MCWLQPGLEEMRWQRGCGGVSLRRGSVRDGGDERGCLLVKQRDVTEVRWWLLRKMPSVRPYTALGLFWVVAVDFCFSSLKFF